MNIVYLIQWQCAWSSSDLSSIVARELFFFGSKIVWDNCNLMQQILTKI